MIGVIAATGDLEESALDLAAADDCGDFPFANHDRAGFALAGDFGGEALGGFAELLFG